VGDPSNEKGLAERALEPRVYRMKGHGSNKGSLLLPDRWIEDSSAGRRSLAYNFCPGKQG
jgi:hypothetical protein